MKTTFNFSIIRYVHDVVGGEFVNVGILLYAPDTDYIGAMCTKKYARLSSVFIDVDGEHFRAIMNHFEIRMEEFRKELEANLGLEPKPRDVLEIGRRVLPADDSSLQLSETRGGLTDNPTDKLSELYERYVERYTRKIERSKRGDDDVWKTFRQRFEEKRISKYLRPHKVIAKNYEHEFQHTWKNEQWRAFEPVSFDLEDSSSILEKAVRWLGRANALEDADEKLRLYLLLGSPQDSRLVSAYAKAENILNKMALAHEFVRESEAESFAADLQDKIRKHVSESDGNL